MEALIIVEKIYIIYTRMDISRRKKKKKKKLSLDLFATAELCRIKISQRL